MTSEGFKLIAKPEKVEGSLSVDEEDTIDQDFPYFDDEGEALDDDVYGAAVVAFVRDIHCLEKYPHANHLGRQSRIATTALMLIFTISLQVMAMMLLKWHIMATELQDIRESYDYFEVTMYGGYENIYYTDGQARGMSGDTFNATRFADIGHGDRKNICQIPLSSPWFILTFVLVWTLVVAAEMRKCLALFDAVVWRTELTDSMLECWQGSDELSCVGGEVSGEVTGVQVIFRLTRCIKAVLALMCCLRFVVTSFLLWLGCHWLMATTRHENIILNTVALWFVLVLKDLVYVALVPTRTRADVKRTQMLKDSAWLDGSQGFRAYGSTTLLWMVLAFSWTLLYVFALQTVLWDFKWDVRDVCEQFFLNEEMSFSTK